MSADVALTAVVEISLTSACCLLQEPESNAEQQQKALQEDDIDNILARAEVVQDTKAEGGGAGDDLLASFNVATFQVRCVPEPGLWEADQQSKFRQNMCCWA